MRQYPPPMYLRLPDEALLAIDEYRRIARPIPSKAAAVTALILEGLAARKRGAAELAAITRRPVRPARQRKWPETSSGGKDRIRGPRIQMTE